jgi:glycosyltransferase involved in cell wall biosynthesis
MTTASMNRARSPATEEERSQPLVSVCLPVRNGAERLPNVIGSVLTQTYEELELVISDNASTDDTEDVCREVAASDARVVYHRHAENVGLLNNFIGAMRMSRGPFLRWVGHDDWMPPESIARSVVPLIEDDRKILATTGVAYTAANGVTSIDDRYDGIRLASEDPIVRLNEMLRLLNESRLLVDPLYGLFRRSPVSRLPRRNMVTEDEVFAAKLALAGPWAHVPEVLLYRGVPHEDSIYDAARKLDVPAWEAYVAGTLQCRDMLRWLRHVPLTPEQRRQATAAVWRMYLHRQRRTVAHRTRKLAGMVTGLSRA